MTRKRDTFLKSVDLTVFHRSKFDKYANEQSRTKKPHRAAIMQRKVKNDFMTYKRLGVPKSSFKRGGLMGCGVLPLVCEPYTGGIQFPLNFFNSFLKHPNSYGNQQKGEKHNKHDPSLQPFCFGNHHTFLIS